MPIRPPALDDRRYDDLVAELLARIPAHTPEWTDPRVGDPGRTLIELFAWLGDALLYRVNLIPERQRLAFLRLLGEPLRPARPARGLVTVDLRPRTPVTAHDVASGARLAGPGAFEASDEFTVLPVTAGVYYKRAVDPGAVPEVLAALADFHAGGGAVAGYATTPLPAEGVDVGADAVDRCLWFALFAPEARTPALQPALNAEAAGVLGGRADGRRRLLSVGLVPGLPGVDPLEPATARPPVPHRWELAVNTSGRPVTEDAPWRPEYLALDAARDGTAGLTRAGVVRLALPPARHLHAPTSDVRADPDAGVGDRPPRLDDEALARRVVAWLRLRPAPPAAPPRTTGEGFAPVDRPAEDAPAAEPAPPLRVVWAGVNAVAVEALITRTDLVIGESDGTADQTFALPAASVEPSTLQLEVVEEGGAVRWTRADDLAVLPRDAAAARDARAFVLDAEAGTIRFGDGVRGRIPPAGARIVVRRMRAGGGAAGNLPAGSLTGITARTVAGAEVGGGLVVTQPLAFTGGADAETLADAERRLPARLRHRDRAVTAGDYETLARETPGVAVGRVALLPRFKPHQRHDDVPGVVTVLVLPDRPLGPAPNPRADRSLLETVHAWLAPRAPLATELYVVGCEYVPLAASVGVTVAADAPIEATLQAVRDALVRALWPLAGGGFDEAGWPLGRAVSNRELAVEAARVPGVAEVAGLNLFTRTGREAWRRLGDARTGREQHLGLARWQLPELLAVHVEAADEAPLAVGADAAVNPFADPSARPLTVPVVPEVC